MKEEWTENVCGDLFVESCYYRFTEEERQDIFDVLGTSRDYPKKNIEHFIEEVEVNLQWLKWMQSAPKKTDHREFLAETAKSIKKTLEGLKKINREYIPIIAIKKQNMEDPIPLCVSPETIVARIAQRVLVEETEKIRGPLEKILRILEHYQVPKKQSKGADRRPTTIFILKAAKIYQKHFGKPTKTSFHAFISVIFQALNLPYEDLERSITLAIKSLQKTT